VGRGTDVIKDGIILVGGFPKPIGGVTTFVRRLAATDQRIEEVVDMFFGKEKERPASYSGKYHALNSKWRGFGYLFFKILLLWRNKYVHFNFSNLTSLAFFLFLPKVSTKWILMLHNGVFENRLPDFLVRHLLRRFDCIVCMSDAQYDDYCLHGVPDSKIIRASSYIPPVCSKPDKVFQLDIDSYFSRKPTFIASGYPARFYNLEWCMRFVASRTEYQLALFVYGDGPEKIEIQNQQFKCENVRVYWDQKEDNFNYALSRAACYLRPTMIDSFGIAVADSVNYGVPVLASDVCPRYQGAETFSITTYESFENALVDLLDDKRGGVGAASAPIVPFSYDLIAP
jgi:hypothetical protein